MIFCSFVYGMKKFIQQIASITMALIVLFSTLSFSLDMHFCGDTLVDYSFYKEANSCDMKAMDATMSKMDCCDDVEIVLEGQDELKISFDTLSFEQQVFVASFVYSYSNLFESYEEELIPFKEYSPPPLIADIQLINEAFLIWF